MKIVILSIQRSGSTLVCDDFIGTNVMGKPTEHYIKLFETEDLNLHTIRSYLSKNSKTPNGVQAVKIMANQLRKINDLYKHNGGRDFKRFLFFKNNGPYDYLFNEYKDAKFIRIYRSDKVAQAVSMVFSGKTNIYHLVKNNSLKDFVGKETQDKININVDFEYSKESIDYHLNFIKEQEECLNNFINTYQIKPIDIKYEDIIHDQNYLYHIAKRLGIKNVTPSERTLMKMAGKNSRIWIDRYKKEANLV